MWNGILWLVSCVLLVLLGLCCYDMVIFVPSYLENGKMLVLAQGKFGLLGSLIALVLKFHLK